MKRIDGTIVSLMVLAPATFSLGLVLGYQEGKNTVKTHVNAPTIVWNDDDESLPIEGGLIEIQESINDTIYVGNAQ